MTEPTVNVLFTWQTFMPDHRQFKQNSIVLTPHDTVIVVKVPIRYNYIANTEKILVEGLYANTVKPLLTPLGMRYVMDQLESVLPDAPIKSGDFNPDTEDEFDGDATTSDDEFGIVSEDDEFETVDPEDELWK